jgi:hypothetical protein
MPNIQKLTLTCKKTLKEYTLSVFSPFSRIVVAKCPICSKREEHTTYDAYPIKTPQKQITY